MSFILFGSLWGCAKTLPQTNHTLSDIAAVSVSCGEMDLSHSYSFRLHVAEGKWLVDALCCTVQYEEKTEFVDCAITEDEKNAVFELLMEIDSASLMENSTKKVKSNSSEVDGSRYSFVLTFSDGTQRSSDRRQPDLEALFYKLAEKYAVTCNQ